MPGGGAAVGDLVSVYGHLALDQSLRVPRILVDLVPLVVGLAVLILVEHHQNDARLRAASVHARVGGAVDRVAVDADVVFARNVDDRVVESERDVAAVGSQRHAALHLSGDGLLGLLPHGLRRVALPVFGHRVHELSRCRAVFVDRGDVGAVLHLLFDHVEGHPVHDRIDGVEDSERHVVGARILHQEDVVLLFREQRIGPRGGLDRPAVALSREGGSEIDGLHAGDLVKVVQPEAHVGDAVVVAAAEREGRQQGGEYLFHLHRCGCFRSRNTMCAGMSPVRTLHLRTPSRE